MPTKGPVGTRQSVTGVWNFARFCLANVISFGQTYFDLILHCASYIKSKFQVVCGEQPKKEWGEFSAAIAKISLKQLRSETYSEGDAGSPSASRLEKIKLFLGIFNGDWRQSEVRHYCSPGCVCNRVTRERLVELAVSAYVEVVLHSRPPIPALNRWLKCSSTARWYLFLGLVMVSVPDVFALSPLVCFCLKS